MFGTLKPHRCALAEPVKAEHDHFYCGLCKSLGDRYGQLSRALVSHDAVFLALLADGLVREPARDGRCRCPLLPVVHRPIVAPDSVAMRFSAAVQMLLGDQWLADRAIEGKLLARAGRPLASRYVEVARVDLAALGIDVSPLEGFEERQAARERRGHTEATTVEEALLGVARPTSEALAFLLDKIALLPGATDEAKREATRRALARLGDGLGRVIYFADALDDLEKDARQGDFNPCVARDRRTGALAPSAKRVEACARLLADALDEVRRAARDLPLERHREVLTNILEHELPRSARRAEAKARAHVESVTVSLLARMSWLERGAHRLLVAAAVLFTWLFGGSPFGARDAAAAPDKKRPSLPPAASVSPPDAGPLAEPSASASPSAPPSASDSPAPSATSDPEEVASPKERDENGNAAEPTGSGSGADRIAPGGHADPAAPSGKPGALCGKGCSGCCNDLCGRCTDPCHGCCGKGGPCDACKGCNACDGCCKGGNCCDGCCKGGDCCGGGGGCCH